MVFLRAITLAALAACVATQASFYPGCTTQTATTYSGQTKQYVWGNNFYGQQGHNQNNTIEPKLTAISSSTTPIVTKCAGGFMHHSAVMSTGKLYVAGDGNSGQLGLGAALMKRSPQFQPVGEIIPFQKADGSNPISFDTSTLSVVDVCSGWSHTCMIVRNSSSGAKKVLCAGSNAKYQLGVSDYISGSFSLFTPVLTSSRNSNGLRTDAQFMDPAQNNFKSIHCGGDFTIGLTDDNYIYAWGDNSLGQCGRSAENPVKLAAQVSLPNLAAGDFVTHVATGYAFAIFVTSLGNVYATGDNSAKQLGSLGLGTTVLIPTKATGTLASLGIDIEAIAAGGYHVAVIAKKKLYTWGEGTLGATGLNVPSSVVRTRWYQEGPVLQPELANINVRLVSAGFKHTMVLDYCNNLYVFGSDAFGQVGAGGSSQSENFRKMKPTLVPRIASWSISVTQLCAGYFHNMVVARASA